MLYIFYYIFLDNNSASPVEKRNRVIYEIFFLVVLKRKIHILYVIEERRCYKIYELIKKINASYFSIYLLGARTS